MIPDSSAVPAVRVFVSSMRFRTSPVLPIRGMLVGFALLMLAACGGGGSSGGGGGSPGGGAVPFQLLSSPQSQSCSIVRESQPLMFVFSHALDPDTFTLSNCDCNTPTVEFSKTHVANDTITLTTDNQWSNTDHWFTVEDTAGKLLTVEPDLTFLDDTALPFFVNGASGDDGNAGTAPDAPFATIQHGVDAARAAVLSGSFTPARQAVLVAEVRSLLGGSQAPADLPGYDNTADPGTPVVTLEDQVHLCGGYAADDWLVRNPATHETRIVSVAGQADQATGYGDTVLTPAAAVVSPVTVSEGTIDGFTIIGPSPTVAPPSNGILGPEFAAGVWMEGYGVIRNSTVYGGRNRCNGECGGATRTGILVSGTGGPDITANEFRSYTGSQVENEYGLYVDISAGAVVEGNEFPGSSADNNYAIYNLGSPSIVGNVAIRGGSGTTSHGIYTAGGGVIESNPLIDGGSGSFASHGIYTDTGSTTYIVYNTAIQGGSGQNSHGIYVNDGSPVIGWNSVAGANGGVGSGGGILGGSGSSTSYGIYVAGGSPGIGGGPCGGCDDPNLIDGGSGPDSYGIYIAAGTPFVYWNGYRTTRVAIGGGSGSNSSTGIHIAGGTPDIQYNGVIHGGSSPLLTTALEDHGTDTTLYMEAFNGGSGANSTGIVAAGTGLSLTQGVVSGGSGATSSVGISVTGTGTVIENALVSGCGHYGGAKPGACTGIADGGTSTVLANNTVFAGSGTNAAAGNVGIDEANTQTAVAILWNNLVFTGGATKDACIAVKDAPTLAFTSLQHNGGFQCGSGTFLVGGVAVAAGDTSPVTADGTYALGDAASLGNAYLGAIAPAAVFHDPGSDPGQIEVPNAIWWNASHVVPATGWALLPTAPANVLAGGMDLKATDTPNYTDLLTNGASYPGFPAFAVDLTGGYPRCRLDTVVGNLVDPTNGGQYWSLGAYMSAYESGGNCYATQ